MDLRFRHCLERSVFIKELPAVQLRFPDRLLQYLPGTLLRADIQRLDATVPQEQRWESVAPQSLAETIRTISSV